MEDLFINRRSSVIFNPTKKLSDQTTTKLLKAAQWSPSSRNLQPWSYIVFDDRTPTQLDKARELLYPGNQLWANNAPLLILSVVHTRRSDGSNHPMALHDIGLANQNLIMQAAALGLVTRFMGGFDKERARNVLQIPDDLAPVAMIAIGYPGNIDDAKPELQERERRKRTRKDLSEIAYLGDLSNPYQTTIPITIDNG